MVVVSWMSALLEITVVSFQLGTGYGRLLLRLSGVFGLAYRMRIALGASCWSRAVAYANATSACFLCFEIVLPA